MESLQEYVRRFGHLFYLVNPNTTTFKTTEEVPNYLNQGVPFFYVLILLEIVVLELRSEKGFTIRLGDVITSVGNGLVYIISGSLTRGVELVGYEWLYERRLLELDWSSPLTWWVAALGADLGYYCVHRFLHGTDGISVLYECKGMKRLWCSRISGRDERAYDEQELETVNYCN